MTGTEHPVTLLACWTETTFTLLSMALWKASRSNLPSGPDLTILLWIPLASWRFSQGTWLELCSESVVTTTSPLPRRRPYAAVLRPSVQFLVNM